MVLCFGTYANAIKKCCLEGTSTQTVVGTLVKTIDENERYSSTEAYNSSKIFNCKIDFAPARKNAGESWDKGLSTIMNLVPDVDVLDLAVKFDTDVQKLLDDDKKELLIGILRGIIKEDQTIDGNKRKFVKYLNMTPEDFVGIHNIDLGKSLAGLFLFVLTSTKNVSEEAKKTIEAILSEDYDKIAKSYIENLYLREARQDSQPSHPRHVPARRVGSDVISEENRHYVLNRIRERNMWEIDRDTYTMMPPEFVNDYEQYAINAAEDYSTIKTLLTHDNPVPFYDLYVYNDVRLESFGSDVFRHIRSYLLFCDRANKESGFTPAKIDFSHQYRGPITISNLTPTKLGIISRFAILTGTGGLGKSVMLQHLMYSCAMDIHKSGQVPLFVSLKDMKEEYGSLVDFIYEFNKGLLSPAISKDKLKEDLKSGGFLILLDAMDEISSKLHGQFDEMLNAFTAEYYNNQFVITSRPYDTFKSYRRFTVFTVQPLSKLQAIKLIENTVFRPDEPYIKDKFLKALDENLYADHKSFAENPLLLNIMLMTFAHTGGISAKMHLFYRDAYKALSFDHDHNKGNYERPLATKLDPEDFGHYLEEFCAKSYKDEVYDYSWDRIDYYLRNLRIKEKERAKFTTRDFIEDLEHNLCLVFFEADEYHYIHRSFQEYFTAVFFSNKKDKHLGKIGRMFEKKATKSRNRDIKAFEMLYDMIPDKVEEYIFLPYLNDLFEECSDDNEKLEYLKILDKVYGSLTFYTREVPYVAENNPLSYLYSFICRTGNFLHNDIYDSCYKDPPYDEAYAEQTYYYGKETDETGEFEIVEESEISIGMSDTEPPDVAGYYCAYPISEILEEEDPDSELVEYFTDKDFLYWHEYQALKGYHKKLKENVEDNDDMDDIFDD